MEKEIHFFNQKKQYERPYGLDAGVRSFYFRHAEKASGDVGADGKISKSLISEKGAEDSVFLGTQLDEPHEDGFKIDWSGSERTLETGKKLTDGYLRNLQEGEFRSKFASRSKIELSDKLFPDGFSKLYMKKWEANKNSLLMERALSPDDYTKLPPSEQAEIAEKAEEPVISEWLGDEKSELVNLMSVDEAAANLAWRLRRDIRMPEKLKSGSREDLFKMTHKTITEPLLMKIIILSNGESPRTLEDIGGSLGLNEGWEVDSFINDSGEEKVRLFLYRVDRSGERPIYVKPLVSR